MKSPHFDKIDLKPVRSKSRGSETEGYGSPDMNKRLDQLFGELNEKIYQRSRSKSREHSPKNVMKAPVAKAISALNVIQQLTENNSDEEKSKESGRLGARRRISRLTDLGSSKQDYSASSQESNIAKPIVKGMLYGNQNQGSLL